MTKSEAAAILRQLGIVVSNPLKVIVETLEARGLIIGMDNVTGDWIVLDKENNIVARVA